MAVLILAALAMRAPAPMLLLIAAFALLWSFVVTFAGRARALRALSSEVLFELTTELVCVRMGRASRCLPLHEIETVELIHLPGSPPLGHVVIQQRGMPRLPPAIPSGRRVSSASVGLAVWTSVELVEPRDQLGEGALTLWFVPDPEQVKSRIEAAARGLSPHARGAHR